MSEQDPELVYGEGFLAYISRTAIPIKKGGEFTKQDYEDMLEIFSRPPQKPVDYWPGSVLLYVDDQHFESIVRSDITITCSVDVADKIKERMKKLNIE